MSGILPTSAAGAGACGQVLNSSFLVGRFFSLKFPKGVVSDERNVASGNRASKQVLLV